jgi:hypothetical protein
VQAHDCADVVVELGHGVDEGVHVMWWVGVCIAVIGDGSTMAQPAFLAILFCQIA